MDFGKALIAGTLALNLHSGMASADEGEMEVGDALIQTTDGVYQIISCENKSINPICLETGTDEGLLIGN